jgi:hypothetical protein
MNGAGGRLGAAVQSAPDPIVYDAAMRRLLKLAGPVCAATLAVVSLTACGDTVHVPQPPSATPFSTITVAQITQQGNAPATIDPSSVTFNPDDSQSLVVHLTVHSTATTPITISVRGSLFDPQLQLIGDVSGGQINVVAGSTVDVQLTGPTPLGTIASAVFEVSTQPTPA